MKQFTIFDQEAQMYLDLRRWDILPYICFEYSGCTLSYNFKFGWLCLHFYCYLKKNINGK